ncbi:nucleoside triphosphate pyrophosphatase [Aliiglaciecola sp. LCG003]|uniref:Maf family protein n=1 Tax=Aliiglaciecola sp. LCG003 TaxID=3053655 RepID=UPI002573B7AC|nr:nucleoside triphosphate pyrophosphatase [Aliiglaciecola sp. LCG003]WJG07749.1 nucleoside triphosphate pyrophosphatase [Aliiglaciecola sp. LCG003]
MGIILASTSPYRKILLEKLGLPFSCQSPQIAEYSLLNETARAMSQRLAVEKASAVARHHTSGIIIGSDQTAALGNEILGKPENHTNAVQQLVRSSGKTVIFYTGLCVIDAQTGRQRSVVEEFKVTFKHLTLHQIENYLHKEQPYDCAGSFKSEGMGICLFSDLQGRDPNSLIGMPLIALCDLLNEFGIDVL